MPSEICFMIDPSFPPRGRVKLEFYVDTLVVSIVKSDHDNSQLIGTSLFPDLRMDLKTCVWAYVNEDNLVPTHSAHSHDQARAGGTYNFRYFRNTWDLKIKRLAIASI